MYGTNSDPIMYIPMGIRVMASDAVACSILSNYIGQMVDLAFQSDRHRSE